MNLVIDVGNTALKAGVFEEDTLVYKETVVQEQLVETVDKIIYKYPLLDKAILSTVSNLSPDQLHKIQDLIDTTILNHHTMLPFSNLYATPHTLGVDRIALVSAAVRQYPGKDVLVIDAGTCITYDFKNSKEEYLGGAIAPGIRLRYKSLNQYTSKLPYLEPEIPENYIGSSTEESIHSGVTQGIIYEIKGAIDNYCNTYSDLTVILTGGDAHFLSKSLKNSIFATSNFLLEGLNYILAFNNSQ